MLCEFALKGTISGERSFAANSRERGRTRANPRELRPRSPTVRQLFLFRELRQRSPAFAKRSANSSRIRPSSRESARSPPRTGELFAKNISDSNQFHIYGERSFAANTRSPAKLFAVSSPRTVFSRTIVRQPRTIVHHKLKFYPYFLANDRSPRTKVRHGEPVRCERFYD